MENKDRIKILRILAGYTQPELSHAAKIPKASLGAIEMGLYNAVGEKGEAIAKALGVSFNYLYQGSPYVDEEHPQVWIPQPATRAQHLQAQKKEISFLFPKFITENRFQVVLAAELTDGLVFFLGRKAEGGKEKFFYTCLLLVENGLAGAFFEAIVRADLKGLNSVGDVAMMKDLMIEKFDINSLYDRIQAGGRFFACDTEQLGKELQAARLKISEKSSTKTTLPPGLEYIFRNSLVALIPSIKPPVAGKLSKFFLKKCEERGHEPNAKIADTLIPEFEQEFRRIGNLPLVSWPDPKNEEYLLLREWLREKLGDDSTTQGQRIAFLEQIAQGTDFKGWKEKYEQAVKEGTRTPLWF